MHSGYLEDAQQWLSEAATPESALAADAETRHGQAAAAVAYWIDELSERQLPQWLSDLMLNDLSLGDLPLTDLSPETAPVPGSVAMQQLQEHCVRIARAFRHCENDDFEAALAQLAQPLAPNSSVTAATPLLRSLRGTAKSLVLTWSGRFPEALAQLETALFSGPAERVLGGIAAELSARLELLTTGEPGALSTSLSRLPGSHRDPVGLLLDRSMSARFEGLQQEASAFLDVASGHVPAVSAEYPGAEYPETEGSPRPRAFFLPSASTADPVLNGIGRSRHQLKLTQLRAQLSTGPQPPTEEQLDS